MLVWYLRDGDLISLPLRLQIFVFKDASDDGKRSWGDDMARAGFHLSAIPLGISA